MRRREVLAGGAVLLVAPFAGCADPAGALHLSAVDDAELAEEASRDTTGLSDDRREAVRGAVEDGSGTVEGTRPPIDDGLPFAYDGRYYDLSWSVVDERTVTQYSIEIDYDPEDATGSSVAFEDLPEVDRRALDDVLPPPDDGRTDGPDLGVSARYTDAEAEESVLVPEQEYELLVHDGNEYRLRADDGRDVTVNTYEYTAEEVAGSAEAYAEQLRNRYLFELSGLSESERGVVQEAIDEGYYAESSSDDDFRAVAERIRSHDAIESNEYDGTYLLRYDGTVYWADLYLGQFADG